MRIAQVLPALNDGGVERSTVDMARYLSAAGVDNWVVSAGGRLVGDVTDAGSQHVTLPVGTKSPWGILRAAWRLARWVDANQISILHARSRAPAWAAWLSRHMSRRKPAFVTTFHGVYGHRSALKRWYNGVMLRGPLVIANSHFIAAHIARIYGVDPNRIVVAQRGVDTTQFTPDRRQSSRQRVRDEVGAGEGPLLVLVARISRWKGHAVLLDALSGLTDRPWTLVLVGGHDTPTLSEELQADVAAGPLRDRVRFLGSRDDVPDLLAASDLAFSVATQPEAFGRAVIEAGASGTPVIASAHGGALETVEDRVTGWLVPPNDTDRLAAAIAAALDAPDQLPVVGQAARAHVAANFSLPAVLAQEASAYHRLSGEGAP